MFGTKTLAEIREELCRAFDLKGPNRFALLSQKMAAMKKDVRKLPPTTDLEKALTKAIDELEQDVRNSKSKQASVGN